VLFLNLGDSYASGGNGGGKWMQKRRYDSPLVNGWRSPPQGLKHKDLCGAPWRVALALQSDGWYLRRDIVWHKSNAQPESVNDRPSGAHEYIFLLEKSPHYFYDKLAIREKTTGTAHDRGNGINPKALKAPAGWDTGSGRHDGVPKGRYKPKQNPSFAASCVRPVDYRNKRSVWTIALQRFAGNHFATFPEEIPRNGILAGTSHAGACAECGAPYRRITEREQLVPPASSDSYDGKWRDTDKQASSKRLLTNMKAGRRAGLPHDNPFPAIITKGWEPSCKCAPAINIPCMVLDPFGGSGRTAVVAKNLGRDFVIIDLSSEYCSMAEDHISCECSQLNMFHSNSNRKCMTSGVGEADV
jgi:hypothetical protein